MDVYWFFSLESKGYHPTAKSFHCIIIVKLFSPCLNDPPHSFLLVSSWWQNPALHKLRKEEKQIIVFPKKLPHLFIHSQACAQSLACYDHYWKPVLEKQGVNMENSPGTHSAGSVVGREALVSISSHMYMWHYNLESLRNCTGIRLTWSEVWGIFLRMPQRLGEWPGGT